MYMYIYSNKDIVRERIYVHAHVHVGSVLTFLDSLAVPVFGFKRTCFFPPVS